VDENEGGMNGRLISTILWGMRTMWGEGGVRKSYSEGARRPALGGDFKRRKKGLGEKRKGAEMEGIGVESNPIDRTQDARLRDKERSR